ncbi:uncharacterized protein FIBRA_09037 [Fibroporia radiculosa]|uniref:Uncharacterized protein n=1 Tax=Fibroporia radiculosa TaxID=599839 RepID=J4GIR5_9APHY|nr:uncharacterized protein FIBRA_09037 [Fibroporia radiculosa]CCM06743.1 predicted protein [Fibroporia radiculosa]
MARLASVQGLWRPLAGVRPLVALYEGTRLSHHYTLSHATLATSAEENPSPERRVCSVSTSLVLERQT